MLISISIPHYIPWATPLPISHFLILHVQDFKGEVHYTCITILTMKSFLQFLFCFIFIFFFFIDISWSSAIMSHSPCKQKHEFIYSSIQRIKAIFFITNHNSKHFVKDLHSICCLIFVYFARCFSKSPASGKMNVLDLFAVRSSADAMDNYLWWVRVLCLLV